MYQVNCTFESLIPTLVSAPLYAGGAAVCRQSLIHQIIMMRVGILAKLLDLRQKAFCLSPSSVMLAVRFSYIAFVVLW